MIRFNAWLMLHSLMMGIDVSIVWIFNRCHNLIMKIGGYFFDRSRKYIPDEYQDQLIELKENDPSCEELGCWK